MEENSCFDTECSVIQANPLRAVLLETKGMKRECTSDIKYYIITTSLIQYIPEAKTNLFLRPNTFITLL
jgi:hypothetical protein